MEKLLVSLNNGRNKTPFEEEKTWKGDRAVR
jgi:hypothetical protein